MAEDSGSATGKRFGCKRVAIIIILLAQTVAALCEQNRFYVEKRIGKHCCALDYVRRLCKQCEGNEFPQDYLNV